MDMPTNRAELIAVATDAGFGIRAAIRLIRHLAIGAGYNPRVGGWIYDDGRTVAHGWQAFANRAASDRAILDRLMAVVEREREAMDPAPDPEMMAAGLRYLEQEKVQAESRRDRAHDWTPGNFGDMCSKLVERPDGRTVPCHEPIKSAIHDPQAFAAYYAELTDALAEWKTRPGFNPDGTRTYATSDGPTVLISPANEPSEVPDAELLQLLAMLDSGVRITRRLYQAWQVSGSPITLDPVKVDRAARAALASGLATQTTDRQGELRVLRAEPIHLLARDREGMETVCKRRLRRAGAQRLRYTTDATKATHDRCLNPRKRHA